MKGTYKLLQNCARVAQRIDGNENRLNLCAKFGVLFLVDFEASHQILHIGRADVRAIGVAEIDNAIRTFKFLEAAFFAILVGQ